MALAETLPDLAGLVVTVPYALIFLVNLTWRTLHADHAPSVLHRIAIDIGIGSIVALATFALAMGVTGDVSTSLPNMLGVLALTGFWLIPPDLIFSNRWMFAKIRKWKEWESLPLDNVQAVSAGPA